MFEKGDAWFRTGDLMRKDDARLFLFRRPRRRHLPLEGRERLDHRGRRGDRRLPRRRTRPTSTASKCRAATAAPAWRRCLSDRASFDLAGLRAHLSAQPAGLCAAAVPARPAAARRHQHLQAAQGRPGAGRLRPGRDRRPDLLQRGAVAELRAPRLRSVPGDTAPAAFGCERRCGLASALHVTSASLPRPRWTFMIEIDAVPYAYTLVPEKTALVVIDMQRDFVEPGGFGAALGNDVTRLQAIVPTVAALHRAVPRQGWPILHTRESHLPDLSRLPAREARTRPCARCGSATRARWAACWCAANPATRSSPTARRGRGEIVVDKPGKGMFCDTDVAAHADDARHHASRLRRRDHGSLRADLDARSQRPRLRVPAGRGRDGELFSRVQGGRHRA